jgi:hypothetical protein
MVRGWIAVAPPSLLLYTPTNAATAAAADTTANLSSSLMFGPIFDYLLVKVLNDPSASVRLSALRGWDSWISRILSLVTITSDCCFRHDQLQLLRPIFHQIMEMIMTTWSCPSTRQIAAILPVVFSSLCTLLQRMDNEDDTHNRNLGGTYLKSITKRILSQPLNRKVRICKNSEQPMFF